MFRKFLLPLITLLVFCINQSYSQSFQFELEQTVSEGNDTLFVSFFVTKTGNVDSTFGNSNFVINVNADALDVPNVSIVEQGIWSAVGGNAAEYLQMTVSPLGLVDSAINFNIRQNLATGTVGTPFPSGVRTLIGTIAIPILDCQAFSRLSWRLPPLQGTGVITSYKNRLLNPSSTFTPPANFELKKNNFILSLSATTICNTDTLKVFASPFVSGLNYSFFRKRANVITLLQTTSDTVINVLDYQDGDSLFLAVDGFCPDTTDFVIIDVDSCLFFADFTVSADTLCKETIATFNVTTFTDSIVEYRWFFGPSSTPATFVGDSITGKGPINVTYSTSGLKTVMLRILNADGRDTTIVKQNFINVRPSVEEAPVLTCGSSTSKYASVVWGAVFGADFYEVRTKINQNGNFSAWTMPSGTLSHLVLANFPDTVYFQVRAIGCDTTYSDIITCRPKFSKNCGIPFYTLQEAKGCIGDVVTVGIVGLPMNSIYKVGWNNGLADTIPTYSFTITQEMTYTIPFVVVDTTDPTCFELGEVVVVVTPRLISKPHLGVQSNSATQVIFNWLPVKDVVEYKIRLSINNSGFGPFITPSSGSLGTEHQVIGLNEGDSLDIQVIAIGGCDTTVSDTIFTVATDSCNTGFTKVSSLLTGCATQDATVFIGLIEKGNFTVNWRNPVTGVQTGFITDTTFTFTPTLANTDYYVRFILRDPLVGNSCDMIDSIKVTTGPSGDSTWTPLQTTFCILDIPSSLENRVDKSGVFTGNGVQFINGKWFFNPKVAGLGTHIITHNVCGAVKSDTFTVTNTPCVYTLGDAPGQPEGIFTTCDGEVYYTDYLANAVFKIDTLGVRTLVFGDTNSVGGDKDGHKSLARISNPAGIVRIENSGVIYFTSNTATSCKVKKYDPLTEEITTIAGSIRGNALTGGVPAGNGSVAPLTAQFVDAWGLALSPESDTLFVVDRSVAKIRKFPIINGVAGNVSTAVGSTPPGNLNGAALTAKFSSSIRHIDLDQKYIYIPDPANNRVAVMDRATGIVSTLTSNPVLSGYQDGPATGNFLDRHRINNPTGIAATANSQIFFTDLQNHAIREIDLQGNIITSAGSFPPNPVNGSANGKPEDSRFNNPVALSYNAKGYIDITDQGNKQIRRFALPKIPNFGPDSFYCYGAPLHAMLSPYEFGEYFVIDGDSNLIVNDTVFNPSADTGWVRIGYQYVYKQCSDVIEFLVYIKPPFDPGVFPDTITICSSDSLVLDASGNGYVAYNWNTAGNLSFSQDSAVVLNNSAIYWVELTDLQGCIGTDTIFIKFLTPPVPLEISGDSISCFGDTVILTATNGFADYLWSTGDTTEFIRTLNAGTYYVTATDTAGCVLIDTFTLKHKNLPFICITTSPESEYGKMSVTTLAGSTAGFANGIGTNARFNRPMTIIVGDSNDLYVTDINNHVIRRITLNDTNVTVFAGVPNSAGTTDGVDRLTAQFNRPFAVAKGKNGKFYVTEDFNHSIRQIEKSGLTKNLAGGLGLAFAGYQDDTASNARFDRPWGISFDDNGNLYIADFNNHNIRKVDTFGVVTTFAGDTNNPPTPGSTDGVGVNASLNWPVQIERDPAGNFYVVEQGSHLVRKISPEGVVTTYAGAPTPGFADGNTASARFSSPFGIAVDKSGTVYVADRGNRVIRKITPLGEVTTIAGKVGQTGSVDGDTSVALFSAALSDLAFDEKTGNLYIADFGNARVRTLSTNKRVKICEGDTATLNAACSQAQSYEWFLNGASLTTDSSIKVTAAGKYVVRVFANGCFNQDSVMVEYLPKPVASLLASDTLVCSNTTNPVTLTASGGDTYQWIFNGVVDTNITANFDTVVTQIGTYQVIAYSAEGCADTSNLVTIDTVSAPLVAFPADTIADCLNTLLDAGLFNNARYFWNGIDSTSGQVLFVDSSGMYEVVVLDTITGCFGFDSVYVKIDTTLDVNLGNDTTVCGGTQLDAGTFSNATYSWSTGDITQVITVSQTGTYFVTVDKGFTCKDSDTVNITVDDGLPITLGPDRQDCQFTTVFVAGIDTTDGRYQYKWTGFDTTSNKPSLKIDTIGIYTITVEVFDTVTKCYGFDTLNISVDTFLNVTIIDSIGCGVVKLDANVPQATYLWSNTGTTQATYVFTSGLYQVIVDKNIPGCADTANINVTVPVGLTIDLGGNDTVCSSKVLDAGTAGQVFAWSTGDTTQTITVTAQGTYSVIVLDTITGCVGVDTVQIAIDTVFNYAFNVDTVKVCGAALLDAGIAPATYLWNTGDTTKTLFAKDTGFYTVTVTLPDGCKGSDSVFVNITQVGLAVNLGTDRQDCQQTILDAGFFADAVYIWNKDTTINTQTLVVDSTNIYEVIVIDTITGCIGFDTIAIQIDTFLTVTIIDSIGCGEVYLSANVPNSTYLWSNGDITENIVVYTSGTYTVFVDNGFVGCTDSASINVTVPQGLNISLGPDRQDCQGSVVFVSGIDTINAVYKYEWNGVISVNQPSVSISGLGNYTISVTVIDTISGCVASDTVQIVIDAVLNVSIFDSLGCGFVKLDALVPNAASYAWNNGGTTKTINVFNTGTYIVTVDKGIAGCIGTDTITITNIPAGLAVTILGDTIGCPSTILSVDSLPSYKIMWNNNAALNTDSVVALTTGTYFVTITDTATGCFGADTISVEITNTVPVSLNLPDTVTACGGIELTANSPISQLSYFWTPTGDTTQTIFAQDSGLYVVTVASVGACVGTDTVFVQFTQGLTISLGNDRQDCQFTTVGIVSGIDTTQNNFVYRWNNNDTLNTSSITVNTTSTVTVIVQDTITGCFGFDTVNITIDTILVVDLGNDTAICGSPYTLNAGITNATYQWTPAGLPATQIVNIDTSGLYSVTVTNAAGCIGTDSINVTINSLPIVNIAGDTLGCDSITLNAGSFANTVSYQWSTSATDTLQTVAVTTSGNYFVTVTDSISGCVGIDSISVTVNVNNLAALTLGADTAFCADIVLTIDATVSGNNNLVYNWNNGALTTPIINIDKTGSYSLLLTDTVTKCQKTDTINVTVFPLPIVFTKADTFRCDGADIVLNAGNAGSTYLWSTGATGQTIIADTVGTYTVRVTSSQGCITNDTIRVRDIARPTVAVIPVDASCTGQTIPLQATATGTELGIDWTTTGFGVIGKIDTLITNYVSNASDAGIRTFTVSVRNSCDTVTASFNTQFFDAPNPIFTASDTVVVFNATGNNLAEPITFKLVEPLVGASYSWNFGDGSAAFNGTNPPSKIYQSEGTFVVRLNAEFSGCRDSSFVRINVQRFTSLFVPNVFAPLAREEENRFLRVYGTSVQDQDFRFRIYSRWGELIYETNSFIEASRVGWNGQKGNSGAELPMGSYTYTLSGKFFDGKTFEKTGTITLLR